MTYAEIVDEVLDCLRKKARSSEGQMIAIDPTTHIFDGGDGGTNYLEVDSMDVAEITMHLEEVFGLSLPDDLEFSDCSTVADLCRMFESAMA